MAFTFSGEMVDLGGGRGWLDRPAADSVFRIDRQLGHLLQITDAGRTWGQQNVEFQTYLRVGYPIALDPDTPSIHQRGAAVDSNEAQRILAIMADHGWYRTVYRWVNGVWTLVEEWHFEHSPERDNHINDPAAPAAQIPSEEDDMLALRIKDGAGRSHLAALGVGVFRHFIEGDNPEWVKNVIRSDDAWVDVPLPQLPALLRTYGCDLQIWDVRDSAFVVLDPLDNTVRSGNMWSAANAARAKLTPIQVNSAETLAYVKELAGKA